MTQYGARHLLIKFSGSRNPVSRRTNQSTADVTAEAASAELQTYVDKINAEGATEEVRQPASRSVSQSGLGLGLEGATEEPVSQPASADLACCVCKYIRMLIAQSAGRLAGPLRAQ